MFGRKSNQIQDEIFEQMPLHPLTLDDPATPIAVHVSGQLRDDVAPIVCIADYYRNMLDFSAFAREFRAVEANYPIVLVDLRGRGRSAYRRSMDQYTPSNDAADVATVLNGLGIERSIILGQGHGGQVAMALAVSHHRKFAGCILIDAGPLVTSLGIVRMRDNFKLIGAVRGQREFETITREFWARSFPGMEERDLDAMALRTHYVARGRVKPRFDTRLLDRLAQVELEDQFEPQWQLFDALTQIPLMLARTQLTDQLQRSTFDRMGDVRSDAVQLVIGGQGSPALLSSSEDVAQIADFARFCSKSARLRAQVAG